MKILIYGEGYDYALALELKRCFEKRNCSVDLFDWTKYLHTAGGCTLKNRAFDKLFKKRVAKKINHGFVEYVGSKSYDSILVITGWFIHPETLKFARKHSKSLVNWSIDEFYNNVFNKITNHETYLLYDCIFSQRKHLFEQYYSKGIKRLEHLPFYYYDGHYPLKTNDAEKEKYGSEVAFLGTWSKNREKTLAVLAEYNFKVWGSHWHKSSKAFKKANTITNECAWLEDMSKVINSTKIIVDVLTEEQNDQMNLKNYQVPACGGFLLTTRTDELLENFKEGHDIACYGSPQELLEKCDYYLSREAERIKIARNLCEKVRNGNNNLIDRADRILQCINSL